MIKNEELEEWLGSPYQRKQKVIVCCHYMDSIRECIHDERLTNDEKFNEIREILKYEYESNSIWYEFVDMHLLKNTIKSV